MSDRQEPGLTTPPEHPRTLLEWARVLQRLDRPIQAAEVLRQALDQLPGVSPGEQRELLGHINRKLSRLLELAGDLDAACTSYLAYLSSHGYGFATTIRAAAPLDVGGSPIPLYTYPAIEYLDQLDYTGKRVFEFGSGHSTLFWAARAAQVIAAENNPAWHAQIAPRVGTNVELLLREGVDFAAVIDEVDGPFDVIAIDCASNRYRAAMKAVPRLLSGGMIILDNSDWYPATAAFLRQQDLIQVDLSGLKPCEYNTSTTSVFLHREFRFVPRGDRQPMPAIGSVAQRSDWDRPPPG